MTLPACITLLIQRRFLSYLFIADGSPLLPLLLLFFFIIFTLRLVSFPQATHQSDLSLIIPHHPRIYYLSTVHDSLSTMAMGGDPSKLIAKPGTIFQVPDE